MMQLIEPFLFQVDLNGICELTPYNESQSNAKFKRLKLDTVKSFSVQAYKNMVGKGLYIYYGQEDGYYLQFPGTDESRDCHVFDPRTR